MINMNANSLKNLPDLNGRFGEFGGRFVAETLMPLILNVEESYEKAIKDKAFLSELDLLRRDYIGRPVKIISGYRSPDYNKKIGGAKRSQHMLAKAADIKIEGMEPWMVYKIIEHLIYEGHMMKGGLGIYETFVHYDVRGRNARWKGKGVKDDRPATKY